MRKALFSLTVTALAVSCFGCGETETPKTEASAKASDSAAPAPSARPGRSGRTAKAQTTDPGKMPSNKMVD